jgi:hypothetical protein
MSAIVPQIVYKNSWSQNTAVSPTTLFTPVTSGLFRISIYGNQLGNPAGNVTWALTWTDATGAQEVSGNGFGGGTGNPNNTVGVECNVFTITVYATDAISFSISIAYPPCAYDAYVEVEAL